VPYLYLATERRRSIAPVTSTIALHLRPQAVRPSPVILKFRAPLAMHMLHPWWVSQEIERSGIFKMFSALLPAPMLENVGVLPAQVLENVGYD
jgi:hypothetical protein